MVSWEWVAIAAAAFAAGMINSVAGGGTLVSFPVLVWAGRDAVLANATSTVALWPASLAGVYGFRREFDGGGWRDVLVLAAPSLAGGVLGAVLLLKTPSGVFARLVPFLILFATGLIMLQEPLSKRVRRAEGERPSRAWWAGAMVFQFLVGVRRLLRRRHRDTDAGVADAAGLHGHLPDERGEEFAGRVD
jgi:uncharacterized protein